MELIVTAKLQAEKHAVVGSVHHLIPLTHFSEGAVNFALYEHLCSQSTTATPGRPAVNGADKGLRWQQVLTTELMTPFLAIVEAFGSESLWGESACPHPEAG